LFIGKKNKQTRRQCIYQIVHNQQEQTKQGNNMGNLVTALSDLFNFQQKKRLLLLGLDAAGKTTLLYKLKLGENVHTIPTVSFYITDHF
jgi:signal recognition particle GTPase